MIKTQKLKAQTEVQLHLPTTQPKIETPAKTDPITKKRKKKKKCKRQNFKAHGPSLR